MQCAKRRLRANGSHVDCVAVQSDGKILVAGYSYSPGSNYNFALARYTSTGALDPSFGSGGKERTGKDVPVGGNSCVKDVDVNPSIMIVKVDHAAHFAGNPGGDSSRNTACRLQ